MKLTNITIAENKGDKGEQIITLPKQTNGTKRRQTYRYPK
jgi:hypothetical protein